MNKILWSSLLLSVLLLVGCNDDKAQQAKIQQLEKQIDFLQKNQMIKVEKEIVFDQEDKIYPVKFNYSSLKTGQEWLDKALLMVLLKDNIKNIDIAKVTKPREVLIEELNKTYNAELAEAKDLFKDQTKKQISGTYFSAEHISNIDYVGQRENILTFTHYRFDYIGGAHGIYNVSYANFDLDKRKEITLDDLFTQENQSKLKDLLWERYEPIYRTDDGNMGFFFQTKKKLYLPKNFYFSGVGINFVYPVYEIGAYADGQKELILHWTDIAELLNQNYKKERGLLAFK